MELQSDLDTISMILPLLIAFYMTYVVIKPSLFGIFIVILSILLFIYRKRIGSWFYVFIALEILYFSSIIIEYLIKPIYKVLFGSSTFPISYWIDQQICYLLDIQIPSLNYIDYPNSSFIDFFGFIYLLQPLLIGLYFFYLSRTSSERFEILAKDTLIASLIFCFLFIFVPSSPPWYILDQKGVNSSNNLGGLIFLFDEASILSNLYNELTIIKFGSLPSVHVFSTAYLAIFNRKQSYGQYIFFFINNFLTIFAVIFLGHHFITDALFGLLIALLLPLRHQNHSTRGLDQIKKL